jgi:hypothetical protein
MPHVLRPVLFIILISLPVRVLWGVWFYPQTQASFTTWSKGCDTCEYVELGKSIRQGQYELEGKPTAFRSPLYPAFIAVFYSPLLLLIAQSVLLTLVALMVYVLSGNMWASLAMALAPATSVIAALPFSETLFTLLLVLGCLLWKYKRFELTGICFGLAWLTRPTILPFLILLLCLAVIRNYRRELLAISLIALLIGVPWTVRNWITLHRFVPVAIGGGGSELLIGTIDIPYGTGGNPWQVINNDPDFRVSQMYDPNWSSLLLHSADERIKANPGRYLITRVKQYPRMWIDNGSYLYGENRTRNTIIKVGFLLLSFITIPLALFAFWRLRHELWELRYMTLFPISLALIYLPLHSDIRYGLTAVPFVIVAISNLGQRWHQGELLTR